MNKEGIEKVVKEAKKIIDTKDGEIKLLKIALDKANGERVVTFKMPDTVEVSNFPHLIKVDVTNQPKVQDVNILNLKDLKLEVQFPKDVSLNIKSDEKAFKWVPAIVMAAVKGLGDLNIKLWKQGMTVRLDATNPMAPIPVILVDHKGKPVNMNVPSPASQVFIMGGGGRVAASSGNILDAYQIADIDESGTVRYYGYIDQSGNWYIMQNDTNANSFRYFKGSGPYPTNWLNRSILSYDYFNVIF